MENTEQQEQRQPEQEMPKESKPQETQQSKEQAPLISEEKPPQYEPKEPKGTKETKEGEEEYKIEVKLSHSSPDLMKFCTEWAVSSIKKERKACEEENRQHMSFRSIAGTVKSALDKEYEPHWHVVCGRSFGSYVTHGTFILFSV